jgi:hypothetical protein
MISDQDAVASTFSGGGVAWRGVTVLSECDQAFKAFRELPGGQVTLE